MNFDNALKEACQSAETKRKQSFVSHYGKPAYDKIKEIKKAILKDPKAKKKIKSKDKESGAYAISTQQVLHK